ncbi:uncharacterized protein [Dendropsophus ebraccatus]|uniref:uncharacterized protein n=1 Tax=Dendropsophus ebraccatus TaxID=150705 RepID=UPI0038322855
MGIEDTPESQTIQDRMFGALAPKKRLVFPIHQNIKTLIKHEWSNPDRKFFIPAAFKRKYPFDQEESSTWGVAPKIDPPVAKIFKQNALPFEDCASLKDPMDKRAEVYLKKDWEASTALFKPLVAATSVSRALEVWLSELKEMISKGTPAEELLKPFDTLEKAMSFVSEASADALKLSARSAAVSNSARRSLWLKEWKGDVTSRSKLCGVPCEGNLLFGPALDNILEKASDKKKGFPLIPQQANRPFKGKGRNTQRAPNTNKKEWRPTKKSKGFLFKNTVPKNLHNDARSLWEVAFHVFSHNGVVFPIARERFVVTDLSSDPEKHVALSLEVQSLLDKRVLIPVPEAEYGRGFYSTLFLVRKPNGSFRTIINLKPLNKVLSYERFKMESVSSAILNLTQDCYMATLDLKDAYYHIPIHPDHQRFLRVAVKLQDSIGHFQYQALPFGISQAPRVFTKVMSEVMAHIREQDIIIVPYLDDFLLIGDSSNSLQAQIRIVEDILSNLGWEINAEKSNKIPSQHCQFLGICLDSRSRKSFLPENKISNICKRTQEFLDTPLTTFRKAMSLLGLFSSCIPAVPWAQYHSRVFQSQILGEWDGATDSLDSSFLLSPQTLRSLSWWKERDNLTRGLPWNLEDVITITTDASPRGWGAHSDSQVFQGQWTPEEARDPQNVRELRAIFFSLSQALPLIENRNVRILTDNSSAVAYINHQGGTRSPQLMRSQEVVLPSFCNTPTNEREASFHSLDVRRAILHYLQVTKEWRLSNNLLISFQGKTKGKTASTQTIARWVKQAIEECYKAKNIDTPVGFGAHSTRAVATSWAERASVSIDQICRAATWSTPHTFYRHYRLQLSSTEDLTFGRREGFALASVDVESLYTRIPQDAGVQAIQEVLSSTDKPESFVQFVGEALAFVLSHNAFKFGDRWFQQVSGVAMGTPVACSLANLFLAVFEKKYIFTLNNHFMRYIVTFLRFMDDIFIVWSGTKAQFEQFVEYLNDGTKMNMKFTSVFGGQQLDFLDVRVEIVDGKLVTSGFRKETATNSLLHFGSYHPPHVKKSLPYSQFLRLRRLNSTEEKFLIQSQELTDRLRERGYSAGVILEAFERARRQRRERILGLELIRNNPDGGDRQKALARKEATWIIRTGAMGALGLNDRNEICLDKDPSSVETAVCRPFVTC